MDPICEQASGFLASVFDTSGLALTIDTEELPDGCHLTIEGADADLLISHGGELLDGVQHLLNQVFIRELPKGQRLVCDARGFRATREAELRAMANHAAERVRSTGVSFNFGPMNANERRLIHLTLADATDLSTESIGEGAGRKLRVSLKKSSQ
jgi:spoIIIJ-associated protein